MKYPTIKLMLSALSLISAALQPAAPAFCADFPAGGDYQVESAVVDNGGGEVLAGGDYAAKGSAGQSLPDNAGVSEGGQYSNRIGFYNPPHFTYQGGLPVVFQMPSGDVQFVLPANSVSKGSFDITLNKDPLNQPLSVPAGTITAANNKMVHNEGAWSQALSSNLSELAIFDEQDFFTGSLPAAGTMSIRYKDDNNDGILDGTDPPVRVDSLSTWSLDEERNSWALVQGAVADKTAKTLTINFQKPGVYAVLGSLVQAIPSYFKAYPVPFRPNGPKAGTGPGQTGTEAAGITFEGVPQTGKIEIFTLDGRLVRTIAIENPPPSNTVNWNVRTATGEKVASGVYIWRVVSGPNSKTGKLMVVW